MKRNSFILVSFLKTSHEKIYIDDVFRGKDGSQNGE